MKADDSRHGTENGYNNLGCRCERCTKAHADYYRHRYATDAHHRRIHLRASWLSYVRRHDARRGGVSPSGADEPGETA